MSDALRFISLFAGIGGIDLGLERAGMKCVAQVEIDDYANRVLAKHWPDVPRFRDVREVGKHNLPAADVLAGGFPCQDISDAGKRAGLAGTKSGLWWEFYRLIQEVQPQYVIAENVAALRSRGLSIILKSLAEIRYDAEWHTISASSIGAPHKRERLFFVAYPHCTRRKLLQVAGGVQTPHAPQLWQSFRTVDKRVWLTSYCNLPRDDDGIPTGMDRFRVLGNAVVPQVAELVGCAVVAHAQQTGVQSDDTANE